MVGRKESVGGSGDGFWMLDGAVTFLNHGSFGSCPRPVLEWQQKLRQRMERQPVQFFVRDLEGLLAEARGELGRFLGASSENLVAVPNATAGVNTVLASFPWKPGDQLILTNHVYNACRNAARHVAEARGVELVEVEIPFPVPAGCELNAPILDAVTRRTRLVMVDHVTSPTALVWPVKELVEGLSSRDIALLVDGAHAPGMVDVNLEQLGAAFYTGNCHKWLCAPKGAGFLYVQPEWQERVRPLAISHGANSQRRDQSRFQLEFGWTGTWDPTAWLSVGRAIACVGGQLPGGWAEVRRRNRQLVLAGRELLLDVVPQQLPCDPELIGAMASVVLPEERERTVPRSALYTDALQEKLLERSAVEVPVVAWPDGAGRLLRISAQLYNRLEDYQRLAESLREALTESV